jgi:hypothetical protein
MPLQNIWTIVQIQMLHVIPHCIYNVIHRMYQMYACVKVVAFGMILRVVIFAVFFNLFFNFKIKSIFLNFSPLSNNW